METIYDITNKSVNYPFLFASVIIILFAVGFYLIGRIKQTKKSLESPFERIDNLSQLENKRSEHQQFSKMSSLFSFGVAILLIFYSIKPILGSFYNSTIKKNTILTGKIHNLSISDFHGIQMVYFKIENEEFGFIKDENYLSKRELENGDSLRISYIKPKGNSQNQKITKIEIITRPNNI